jgi:hypothetical protein
MTNRFDSGPTFPAPIPYPPKPHGNHTHPAPILPPYIRQPNDGFIEERVNTSQLLFTKPTTHVKGAREGSIDEFKDDASPERVLSVFINGTSRLTFNVNKQVDITTKLFPFEHKIFIQYPR